MSETIDFSAFLENPEEKENGHCVVRLRTSTWSDNRGAYQKRSITYLRRKSSGVNGVEMGIDDAGADEFFAMLTNINSCDDGIYEVVMCDPSKDWETGYLNSWNYKLIPLEVK